MPVPGLMAIIQGWWNFQECESSRPSVRHSNESRMQTAKRQVSRKGDKEIRQLDTGFRRYDGSGVCDSCNSPAPQGPTYGAWPNVGV